MDAGLHATGSVRWPTLALISLLYSLYIAGRGEVGHGCEQSGEDA